MVYILEGDHFVSEKQRRTAEVLSDFYPHLQLQFIPPQERRSEDDRNNNFRVVDCSPGRQPYVVCFAEEADERLLAKVIQADNTRRDVSNYLDAHNAATEIMMAKQHEEDRQELHEFMYAALRHRKYNYMHAGINWGMRMR